MLAAVAETPQVSSNVPPAESVALGRQIIAHSGLLVDADTLPELQQARAEGMQEAQAVLENNRNLALQGLDSPLPHDVVGESEQLAQIARTKGKRSAEYVDRHEGLKVSARTLIAEVTSTYRRRLFPRLTQQLNSDGKYEFHGSEVLNVTRNGLSALTGYLEEEQRSTNDHAKEVVNHAIPRIQKLGSLGLQGALHTIEIAECPDWVIQAYKEGDTGAYAGYVPAIKKMMLQGMRFNEDGTREQEMLALPGTHITHDVILRVLEKLGGINEGDQLNKTEVHGKQFIDIHELGVLGFAAKLDEVASEQSGKNIFLGEVVPDDYIKDYQQAVIEATQQEEANKHLVAPLTQLLINLEANGTDKIANEHILEAHINDALWEEVLENPDRAEEIFGKETADRLRKAAELEKQGLHKEANELRILAEKEAPPSTYCGGGSCGLETVAEGTPDAIVARRMGLRGRKLRKDKERACKACSNFGLVYDADNGDTACVDCGSSKIGGVINANYN